MQRARKSEQESRRKMLDDAVGSLNSSYKFLERGTLSQLQDHMTGLARLRNPDLLSESLAKILEPSEALRRAVHAANPPWKNIIGNAALRHREESFARNMPLEVPPVPIIRRPEDTAVGRATLESAKNTRETLARVDALVSQIGGLHEVMVGRVLPAWFKKVEEDQQQANEAIAHARRSLRFAIGTLLASVAVAILVAWWQIHVAQELSGAGAPATEALLKDQLTVLQRNGERQAEAFTRLQQQLERDAKETERLRQAIEARQPVPPTK